MPGAVVTGWGIAVPDKVVTNDDLSARLDTSDQWIAERTGIQRAADRGDDGRARHRGRRAGPGPGRADAATTSTCVVLATSTPDALVPGTSATVQDGLGIARRRLRRRTRRARVSSTPWSPPTGSCSPAHERVLVIGSETLSQITDWDDRSIAVLVGDGAGAVVLEATDGPGRAAGMGPRSRRLAAAPAEVRSRRLPLHERQGDLPPRRARDRGVVAAGAWTRPGSTPGDVDLFVPHQANARIITAASQRLGIPDERCVVTIDRYGNTSSASIPLALARRARDRPAPPGRIVVCLSGFGGGMTWASAVLRWGG